MIAQNAVSNGTNAQDVTRAQAATIGIGLLVFFLLFLYLLVELWPTKGSLVSITIATPAPTQTGANIATPMPTLPPVKTTPGQNAGDWNPNAVIFGVVIRMSSDVRFLLMIALAAALGGFVQIATSFSTFLGNRLFKRSWLWWYLLRIPIGVSLALLFYFAVRGGFFTTVSGMDVNPFGVTALGGLVGMFSKQASDKLQDVFEELFKSDQDKARDDKLDGAPTVTGANPANLTNTSTQVALVGTGFAAGATVTVNGNSRKVDYVDAQTLNVTLQPSDVQAPATLSVVVTNPAPNSKSSSAYSITVS